MLHGACVRKGKGEIYMIGIGIVGTGWVAAYHVRALRELGMEITAVVGSSGEKAEAFAKEWGISRYGAEPDLLFAPEITAVHICTPPERHYGQIRTLLLHGKHIFCEKPLSLCKKEAQELAELADRSGLVCRVGFNIRAYAQCQKARALVREGALGRLLLIHGSYLQEFGVSPAQWSWRYESALHAVTEIGSHWLDLAQYLSGERISAVSAVSDKFHPVRYKKEGLLYTETQEGAETVSVPSEDVALIHFRTEKGAIGSVVLSELSHGHGNCLTVELTGEKASLSWNSEAPSELSFSRKGYRESLWQEDSFEATFRNQFRSFYESVEEGTATLLPDFREAYGNVALCEAILESDRNNAQWVEVSL